MKTFEQEQQEMIESSKKFADSAYPLVYEFQYESNPGKGFRSVSKGLSKREYFAAMALQGFLANPVHSQLGSKAAAQKSVVFADAIISELNKELNK